MHCPNCGNSLETVRTFPTYWALFLKCARCREAFMHLDDERAQFPPLLPLHDRRAEKALMHADERVTEEAFAILKVHDDRTISLSAFVEFLVKTWHSTNSNDGSANQ